MKNLVLISGLIFTLLVPAYQSRQIKLAFMFEKWDPKPKAGDTPAFYTYSNIPLSSEKDIFVVGTTGFCFFKINGKIITLDHVNTKKDSTGYTDRFEGNGYTAVLSVSKIRAVIPKDSVRRGSSIREGTLTVYNKTGRSSFKVHGVSDQYDEYYMRIYRKE